MKLRGFKMIQILRVRIMTDMIGSVDNSIHENARKMYGICSTYTVVVVKYLEADIDHC
jgi:hypothetical protein